MRLFRLLLLSFLLPVLAGCAVAAVGGAAVTTAVVLDNRDTGTQLSDSGLRLRAQAAIDDVPELDDQRVLLVAHNNHVLLYGQVATSSQRDRATRAIAGVEGINRTYNQLRVGEKISLSRRTQDSLLTMRVKSSLLAERQLAKAGIKVISEDGEVFLLGIVGREDAQAALEKVRHINGVQRVIDVLTIKGN